MNVCVSHRVSTSIACVSLDH